jgi:4-amino-4-deoxy-L-arabinose transferase-like glycosyltransferase
MGWGWGTTRARAWWWLLAVPMVASAAVRDLWAPDEPRYAEISRGVYESGSFLVLHLCGQLYSDKPPLLFWLSGLFGWIGGWQELLLRLPTLAATLGTAWVVARLARRWWGELAAAWAPALYLATALVTYLGGRIQIDPLLVFLCTLSLDLATRPLAPGRSRGADLAWSGLVLGLAALTKGPVAWVNVGLPLVAWRWLQPGFVPPARRRHWLGFALLALAPALAWATAASVAEPVLARDLFFGQHAGRITDVGERHPGPPWQYLGQMPVWLLPATFLVLAGIAEAWRDLRRGRRGEPADAGLVAALAWLLPLFLFYSAIPPKRELYLLPAFPAAALLGARILARAIERRALPRWVALATPGLLVVLAVALSLVGFAARDLPLPGLLWRGPLIAAPLLAGSLAALVRFRRGDPRGWAVSLLAGWCACATLLALVGFWSANPLKSSRALAVELATRPEKPVDIPCLLGVQPAGFRFYSGVPAVRADDLRPALARDGANFLGLVNDKSWKRLDPATQALFRIVAERQVGGARILILGAAPTPPAAVTP